jgi:hypothetical protein
VCITIGGYNGIQVRSVGWGKDILKLYGRASRGKEEEKEEEEDTLK